MKNYTKCDRGYWAIVTDVGTMAHNIRRTRTEVIQSFCGPEEGYQKRWRRVKRWKTHPRTVRVTVTWVTGSRKNGPTSRHGRG